MCGNAYRAHAQIISPAQFFNGSQSRQDQCREYRIFEHVGDSFEPFPISVRAKSVIETRTRQTITMGDLDGIDASIINCPGNGFDVINPVHVPDGMHAIAQRHILNIDFVATFDGE